MSKPLGAVKFCECGAMLHLKNTNMGNILLFCKCGYSKVVYDRNGKAECKVEDGVTLDTIETFVMPHVFGQNEGYIIVSK